MIYSGANKDSFHFGTGRMSEYQLYFLRKFGRLIREHGVHLVMLDHPPAFPAVQSKVERGRTALFHPTETKPEVNIPKVEMYCNWPEVIGVPMDILGVPKARLFAGLSPDEVQRFYSDRVHLNPNGRPYFTRVLMPAILKLYDQEAKAD
jgi:hypothetical protein